MSYKEEVLTWFDSDRLMSRRPFPETLNEEGNPILETGTAYAFMAWLGEADIKDSEEFEKAILAFERCPGLPNKKPRSNDLVTHDDLIGLVAGSVAFKKFQCFFQTEICNYGFAHDWFFSNNGDDQWEAHVKPWHKCFYMLADNREPGLYLLVMFALSILFDAFIHMDSASDKRLTYLMIKTISNKSFIVDLASKVWWWRIRRVYGRAARIFIMLKGEKHPFSVYCPD